MEPRSSRKVPSLEEGGPLGEGRIVSRLQLRGKVQLDEKTKSEVVEFVSCLSGVGRSQQLLFNHIRFSNQEHIARSI